MQKTHKFRVTFLAGEDTNNMKKFTRVLDLPATSKKQAINAFRVVIFAGFMNGMRLTAIKNRGSGKTLDFKGHFKILEVEKIE